MCELNAIELGWAKVKHYIRSRNTTGEFSITTLRQLTEEGIMSVSKEDWYKFSNHVKKIEDNFWLTDQHMEEVEPLVISINNDSDSESDTDSECSNSDNEN